MMSSSFVTRIEPDTNEPYTVIFSTNNYDKYLHIEDECRKVVDYATPTTNIDKIRHMTPEEMAEWLDGMISDCDCNDVPCRLFCPASYGFTENKSCRDAWLDWLRSRVVDA